MVRILFLLLLIIQAASCYASGSLVMPDQPVLESYPKSKEIKKVTKILEDPIEREKLIKTLKVLASTQEAEEKKAGGSLTAYFLPLIQMVKKGTSTFLENLQQIPIIIGDFIDYLKIEDNRQDLWKALLFWFPVFIGIEIILEKLWIWFLQLTYQARRNDKSVRVLMESKANYAGAKLVFPFLTPVLFLPLLTMNFNTKRWLIAFWILLYAFRIILLYRTELPTFISNSSLENVKTSKLSRITLYIFLLGLFLSGVVVSAWTLNNDGLLLPSIFFLLYPYLILGVLEWQKVKMPGFLRDSKNLPTVPHQIAPIINIFIKWLPRVVLLVLLPLGIDKIFYDGHLWNQYTLETAGSLVLLMVFLIGRYLINFIAQYRLSIEEKKSQTIPSYIAHIRLPLAKGIQWIWHISFFGILLGVWNYFFSSFFVNIISHPLTKIITTVGLIWGIIYLIWLALDFFVQFHTKPQLIKGKRREPTIFAKTFGPMLHSVAKWIMVLVAFFITLESFGFDLKILVYLMSAFAFAVSLGSQSLVKDIINGFFALVDGSFAVGEVVTVGTHTGAVESLSLRAITLRHTDGSLQTIPFSEVGNIINRSRGYSIVPIDVATSYKTKIGNVYEALSKAFNDMTEDPLFGKMIIEPLIVSGIDRFSDNSVHVSASIKIMSDPYRKFAQEFNRRLKIHLDAFKIAPPIAFQEMWNQNKK